MTKTIVIKIGTNILTSPDGSLNDARIQSVTSQIAALKQTEEVNIAVVTSGAITSGKGIIDVKAESLPEKQALASVGQHHLLATYSKYFQAHGLSIGQLLLTKDGLADATRQSHVINTMSTLFKHNAIPIINQNDSVAIDEIAFGDNDELSSRVAILLNADFYIILSDIDGLYTKNPAKFDDGELIPEVRTISDDLLNIAEGPSDDQSTGGMHSKLNAAKQAMDQGVHTFIGHGHTDNIILDAYKGQAKGTYFKGES